MSSESPRQPLEIVGISWVTTIFLFSTLVVSLIGGPWFAWSFPVGWFELVLFVAMMYLTGMSITVGYHRLFSHRAYQAKWPVRLFVCLFGAGAFQMSALKWSAEHRHHHKHTDQDGDPHDPHSIARGFWWAHMGWLLVKVDPRLRHDNVEDLRRDPILAWQERWYVPIAIVMGFFVPMAVGAGWYAFTGRDVLVGVLSGFLFGGTIRIVAVHHMTWFINSLAHSIGSRPYDSEASSRDNGLLALFTFGEGYHNYHHAFQTDYRNGVRFWQFDPTKWVIWTLSKVGLASNLRRIPAETIRLARLRERQRQIERRIAEDRVELSDTLASWLRELDAKAEELHLQLRTLLNESTRQARAKMHRSSEQRREVEAKLRQVRREFAATLQAWKLAHRQAMALAAAPA